MLASFRRDDPRLASLFAQLNMGSWKDVPLTLRLNFQPSGDHVVVSGVEGKGWLILGGAEQDRH